ncbi:hypothetical protein ACLB1S_24365 [Escherichia coli]
MGIAGSSLITTSLNTWLGMKIKAVDMTELRRRMDS